MTDGMNSFASTWFLLENEHVVGCHKGYIYFTEHNSLGTNYRSTTTVK